MYVCMQGSLTQVIACTCYAVKLSLTAVSFVFTMFVCMYVCTVYMYSYRMFVYARGYLRMYQHLAVCFVCICMYVDNVYVYI